ncbi:MAG TPA: gluconokinase [Thermomicrobiales bacterium]|nr:gluconokinase [Thermomicrobiales bacterium]
MSDPVALAIDAGSSSVRAALYDEHAELLPGTLCQIEIDIALYPGGVAQLDAAHVRQALEAAIDSVLAAAPAIRADIAVVAMTTFWHSCVAVDGKGAPLTPVLTWADTRSEPEAAALRDMLDAESVHRRTGCLLHPSYLPAKILWLRRHEPSLFERLAALVSFAQYCTMAWLGTMATSVSMASGSGMFNDASGSWDSELLDVLRVSGQTLGQIATGRELLPAVTGDYARRWPRLSGVPWRAPIGDGAASNVGAGCHVADRLALMVGTSGALRRCEPAPATDPVPHGLWRYRLDRGHVLTGGALSDAGNAYAWLQDTLRLPSEDRCEAELATRLPGQHGLVVLPFWSGERSLGWVGDATATVAGMKLHTTPLDLFQAALEGVTYRFGALFDAMARGGDTVVATGGGLRASPAWLQLMADALGTPVVASAVSQSSLRGAAIVGLRDVGATSGSAWPAAPVGARFEPRVDYHELHREARARQATLYDREIGPAGSNLLARQTR